MQSTTVYYHDWGLRGARVSCTPVTIETRLSRLNPMTWIGGFWGVKAIPLSSIKAGFEIGPAIRLVFDTDDEIVFDPSPISSYEPDDLGFPIIVESLAARDLWPAIKDMRDRQRVLPPASWQKGRGRGRIQSVRMAAAARIAPIVAICAFVVWSVLKRWIG